MGLETGCCRQQGLRPAGLADRYGVGAGTTRPGIHALLDTPCHMLTLAGDHRRAVEANPLFRAVGQPEVPRIDLGVKGSTGIRPDAEVADTGRGRPLVPSPHFTHRPVDLVADGWPGGAER